MIERSGSKNVGLIIPGTNNDRILKIAPGDNIPSAGLKYKEQIEMALIGNTVKPKKLVVAFSGVDHAEIDDALNALADENVSYAAVSTQTETVASKVVSWVKEQREIGKNIKAVLSDLYERLGYKKTAKATDLELYYIMKPILTPEKQNGFELIGKR